MYANDFKLDDTPILGKKPDYEKLKQLGEKGIKVVIVDSTRADEDGKTPSESVAREMLRDVLFSINDNAIFVTTFASQIQRLKSVMEFGKRMNRKVVFLGRSMDKYTRAAERLNLVNFKGVDIVGYGNKIKKKLRDINKNKEKYLVACTGNQGEPKSVLSKIANDELKFKFEEGDSVIFSCNTIPTETNIRNREIIEKKLKDKKVRLFKDVHTSGHCRREDLRKFLMLVKAQNIIPSHGTQDKLKSVKDLAEEITHYDEKRYSPKPAASSRSSATCSPHTPRSRLLDSRFLRLSVETCRPSVILAVLASCSRIAAFCLVRSPTSRRLPSSCFSSPLVISANNF